MKKNSDLKKEQAITFVPEGESWKEEAIQIVPAGENWKHDAIIFDTDTLPEDINYLLLIVYHDEDMDDDIKTFEWIRGREEVYKFLKNYIESECIDMVESKVLTEVVQAGKGITVLQFMRYIRDKELIIDETGFDIEEYVLDEPELTGDID